MAAAARRAKPVLGNYSGPLIVTPRDRSYAWFRQARDVIATGTWQNLDTSGCTTVSVHMGMEGAYSFYL